MTADTATVMTWLERMAAGIVDLTKDNQGLAKQALALLAPLALAPLPPGALSPHFTLAELTYSDTAKARGIDNTPDAAAVALLTALARDTLERIRSICDDNPLIVSSGYRSSQLNAAVGGASNSAHLYGCAADFTIPGFGSVDAVCRAIEPHLAEFEIDQLIDESGGGAEWVHVGRAIPPSTTPRHQTLTITNGETISGLA